MKKLMLLFALMVATGTFKAYAQIVEYRFDATCNYTACTTDNCHGRGTALPFSFNSGVLASASAFNLGPGLTSSSTTCGGSPMNGYAAGDTGPPAPIVGSGRRARWANNWLVAPLAVNPSSDYFTFTLTTLPFLNVQITEIRWRERKSSQGPTLRQLRTSTDGFVTSTIFAVASNTDTTTWVTRNVTTGLPVFTSSIEIRIYGYSATSTNGTLRIDNVVVFATPLNLPIELLSFNGEKVGEDVNLHWSTATEQNNERFTLYRSPDAMSWQEIGRVPGAGTSQIRIDYQFVDGSPHVGTNYYCLRQTDFDGTFVDSEVIAVDVDVGNSFVAFPNPIQRGEPVQTSKKIDFIFDGLGKLVPFDPTSIVIEIPGVYTLVHLDENGFSATSRLIVNP